MEAIHLGQNMEQLEITAANNLRIILQFTSSSNTQQSSSAAKGSGTNNRKRVRPTVTKGVDTKKEKKKFQYDLEETSEPWTPVNEVVKELEVEKAEKMPKSRVKEKKTVSI